MLSEVPRQACSEYPLTAHLCDVCDSKWKRGGPESSIMPEWCNILLSLFCVIYSWQSTEIALWHLTEINWDPKRYLTSKSPPRNMSLYPKVKCRTRAVVRFLFQKDRNNKIVGGFKEQISMALTWSAVEGVASTEGVREEQRAGLLLAVTAFVFSILFARCLHSKFPKQAFTFRPGISFLRENRHSESWGPLSQESST